MPDDALRYPYRFITLGTTQTALKKIEWERSVKIWCVAEDISELCCTSLPVAPSCSSQCAVSVPHDGRCAARNNQRHDSQARHQHAHGDRSSFKYCDIRFLRSKQQQDIILKLSTHAPPAYPPLVPPPRDADNYLRPSSTASFSYIQRRTSKSPKYLYRLVQAQTLNTRHTAFNAPRRRQRPRRPPRRPMG